MVFSSSEDKTNTCRLQLDQGEENCVQRARELLGNARVAFLHDWLTGMRGGERCLEVLCEMFPNSDIFTLFAKPEKICLPIKTRIRHTSFLNGLPSIEKYYRYLLPLFPFAAWDLKRKLARAHKDRHYDAVISISHCAVKNIAPPPGLRHICYCLTPVRYLWDQYQAYFGKSKLEFLIRPIAAVLRAWDRSGSKHVDEFIAISQFVAERIKRYYEREAVVIYPPVDFSWLNPQENAEKQRGPLRFVCVCALVPYKKVDEVISAFNALPYRLTIVGQGPEYARLRNLAGPNIEFVSGLSDQELAQIYAESSAMVFVAEEDFGMSTVEMLASGRPVIASNKGGSAEIVGGLPQQFLGIKEFFTIGKAVSGIDIENLEFSGILLDDITSDSIKTAVAFLAEHPQVFKPECCRNSASRFSIQNFCDSLCNHFSS